jgi:hypothetical protein
MSNVDLTHGPRDLERCDVWPKDRAHLLEPCYDYEHVTTLIKGSFNISECLLRFHYPSLYDNEMVLFCDTGDHLVVYIAVKIDEAKERM